MKKFWIDSVIATAFVFLILGAIVQVSQFNVFNVFDPLGKALSDIQLTDITFSKLRIEPPPPDENILLVNIGNLSRAQIAEQVRVISQFKPKVIGIDVFFDCPYCLTEKVDSLCCPLAYDTLSNMMLRSAIEDAGNVVLVTKLLQTKALVKRYGDVVKYDSLRHTDSLILGNALEGFASLPTEADIQDDLKVCREFYPKMTMENSGLIEYAFSVKTAMMFDSVKTKKFLARENFLEIINYRGNVPDVYRASNPDFANRYAYLDWYQPFDTTSYLHSLVKDRIVLFGFMGANMDDTSWDDKFITPLNNQYAGKTRPDMYGVVVHANIISMILDEAYIEQLEPWHEFAIAAIVCFLNVMLFTYITKKVPHWFDGLSILIQLIQFVVCTFLMIYAMYWFNFKLNLTLTLAALALVGTCFELYHGVVKNTLHVVKNKWFTKKDKEVLTP